jgi:flagellin-like protein
MTQQRDRYRDRAVSPVIGVILMVAITVIVAAVIGTFVLGNVEGVSNPAQAGLTVEEEEGTSLTFEIKKPGNVDKIEIRAPVGQEFKEVEGECLPFFGGIWSGGFPDNGYSGNWSRSDDKSSFVLEDPRAGNSITMDLTADVYEPASDKQNIEEGDIFTVVAFTDNGRNVLREHEASSDIFVDGGNC